MKYLFISTLFTVFIHLATAQGLSKIDSVAHSLIENYNIPGIAMVAVKGDHVVYTGHFGEASKSVPFSENSRLYIASNTKAFVGLAIAQLAHRNKLKYSDPVTRYIDAQYFPESIAAEKISISDLLQHTHGLSNDPMVFRTAFSGEYPSDLKKLLKFTVYQNDTLSHDFKYSNLGYLIAGIIIEEVSGRPWEKYVAEEILGPLQMTKTSTSSDYPDEQEVLPYFFHSEMPLSSIKTNNTLHAAGGIYSTLEDMSKWLRVFTSPENQQFDKELMNLYFSETTEVAERMGPFTMNEYGNGWINGNFMDQALNFHFGRFHGYESMISFMPEHDLGVFVFVNEKAGGLRVSAMLSAYYYLLMTESPGLGQALGMFNKMIASEYEGGKPPTGEIFNYSSVDDLTGVYFSDEYGQLMVDHKPEGYIFRIGKLESLAYRGATANQFVLEWTPGIEEHFTISEADGQIKLIYGDFDDFEKL